MAAFQTVKKLSFRASAHTGVGIRSQKVPFLSSLQEKRWVLDTDCHTRKIVHWFAMTELRIFRQTQNEPVSENRLVFYALLSVFCFAVGYAFFTSVMPKI